MGYSYLASPYCNPDRPADRQYCKARYDEACRAAAKLMGQGHLIFCPIAHSHPIAAWLPDAQRTSHDFWLRQDFALLTMADRLIVLQLHQWKRSVGVAAEIEFARDNGIPVEYLEPGKL
ncbi:MAG: DUF1937 family protein [Sulfuricaulis sp.]|nr:DUF1937 family protein [Sulfuricaulis sp.]